MTTTPTETADLDRPYEAMAGADWYAIVARANMGFRFGPYSGPEVGEIVKRCTEEGIPVVVSAECGRTFDWDLARDFGRGQPANWRPMSEAPRDPPEIIIGDVACFEHRIFWFKEWQAWRLIDDHGRPGEPVSPLRWREAEAVIL